MTDGDLLLKAVLEFPADDFPRLQLADWLEENGEGERAEFVRVQIELGPLRCWQGGDLGDPQNETEIAELRRFNALRRRERELLKRAFRWLGFDYNRQGGHILFGDGAMGFWLSDTTPHCVARFRRGFIEAVACTAADWLAHADALTAACPLREVTLTTWPTERFGGMTGTRQEYEKCLAAEWPGITFELPR